MFTKAATSICSIVIPAYNEENCIGATLWSLTEGMRAREFDIIVVCNGCSDNTAAAAIAAFPQARVIETEIASKTHALNMGMQEAHCETVVFLDADIKTTALSVRLLLSALRATRQHLAYGKASFRTTKCSAPVRSFYKAWKLNPYFDGGKVGGFFAVSMAGLNSLGHFPSITNDDEYVRRKLMAKSVFVPAATYIVEPPRTVLSLIKVRSRVYRGNRELTSFGLPVAVNQPHKNGYRFLRRLMRTPSAWSGACVFSVVAAAAHLRNRFFNTSGQWEQDPTARTVQN